MSEANKLLEAALTNKQIGWIIGDSDVSNFYLMLVANFIGVADEALIDPFVDILGLNSTNDEEGADEDKPAPKADH